MATRTGTGESELRRRLEELHRELEATEEVDPEAQALLGDVMEDIRELLERSGESPHTHESLAERLVEAARHYEESHPALFAMVGRVVDTLSNLGI
jgi:predicted transcriptional regulator